MSFFKNLMKKTGPISVSDVDDLKMVLLYQKMAPIFNHSNILKPEFYQTLKACEFPTNQICGKDMTMWNFRKFNNLFGMLRKKQKKTPKSQNFFF